MIHIMSDFTNRTTPTTGDQPSKKRRRALWGGVAVVGVAGIAAGLFVWKPWVDHAPFTAVIGSASKGASTDGLDAGSGDTKCTPNMAGETIVIYDKSGKRKLAEGVTSQVGERLPGSYGDFAGYCFHVTRVEGVPAGEDGYKIQVGGGNLAPVTEEDLRLRADAQREKLKTTKMPDDSESATE